MSESEAEGSDGDFEEADYLTDTEVYEDVTQEDEEMLANLSEAEPSTSSPRRSSSKTKPKEESLRQSNEKLKKPIYTCKSCSRERSYYSLEGVKNHMMQHRVLELMRSGPGFSVAVSEIRKVVKDVFKELSDLDIKEGYTPQIEEAATYLMNLSDACADTVCNFADSVAAVVWNCLPLPTMVTPDDMHSTYRKAIFKASCEMCVKGSLKNDLKTLIVPGVSKVPQDETLTWMVTAIINRCAVKLEVFYLRSLREPYFVLGDIAAASTPTEEKKWDDLNFKQSVHYVGGSALRSVVRLAYNQNKHGWDKSGKWKTLSDCVKAKLCSGLDVTGPDEEISSWTEARDRGGLMHLSESAWAFFMGLSGILHNMEETGCPLKVDNVLANVRSDEVVYALWTDAIGDTLQGEDAEFLLEQLCSRFTNTYGDGMSLKARNTILDNLTDKAPLRATLLFRKV